MNKDRKPFLQEVAESIFEKYGDALENCTIIFNNKRPSNYLQKYLADIVKKPFFSPNFLTIQEFYASTSTFKIADFYRQFFTLHKIYNQLLKEEQMEAISSHKFFPLAKVILSDFNQIDSDLVDANQLYRDLEDISVINQEFDYLSKEQYGFLAQFWTSYSEGKHKRQQELFIKMWRRMPKLYHLFHKTLQSENFITNGHAYRSLAESSDLGAVLDKNFSKGKLLFVGFNALSKSEAIVFSALQKLDKAKFYFDSDPYYVEDPLQEAGLFLRKNLSQLGLVNEFAHFPSFMNTGEHSVDVYKVQGQTIQAKILNDILAPAYTHNEEVGSTVVVLADESLLIPTLQTIPTSFNGKDIDLNVTMGFALATSSIFGLIDLWLDSQQELIQKTTVSFKNVEAFISHPLSGLSQKMRDKIQTALLTENVVEIEHLRLLRQSGLFEIFYKKIEESTEVISTLLAMLDFVLLRLSNAKSLKKIDAELFVKTIQELNRLHDTVGKHIRNEAIPFVIYLVKKALSSISVPLSGDPLNGIQVMGLLETRNLNFDNVVILGFNEGIIPKTSIGQSFIPDSLRRVYGLPVLENLDAISSYMVYRLIQRAKNISLVYNNLTDESTSGEPSRILKQLEFESGFNFTYHELNLNIKTEAPRTVRIEKAGNQLIEAVLQKYLNKTKVLSPSAITQYIANPVDFFFNYIAGIKEPKEISAVVEANEIGSILHKVMEYFYHDLKNIEITEAEITRRRKSVPELIQRAFNAVMFNLPEKDIDHKGMQKVVIAIVEAYVNIILDQDITQTPFQIISLEQKVEAEIPFILGGQEVSVKIFGFIDRVDLKDGITKIVDYKTGSDQLKFKDVSGLFNTDGKDINKALIQTLLYTYAYEQSVGKSFVEPNLYILKKMRQDGVLFKSGKQELTGVYLEEVKAEFLSFLKEKLAELFEQPYFEISAVPDNYKYSIYKTLFGK